MRRSRIARSSGRDPGIGGKRCRTLTSGNACRPACHQTPHCRCKSELNELRVEVDAFTSAVPPPWRLEREDTQDVEALVSYIDREPDPAWGDRIGYIAVKARSALDQLMTQLVVDSGNDPSKRKSYFPIFVHADAPTSHSRRRAARASGTGVWREWPAVTAGSSINCSRFSEA
jgi:hypothetical protein